jgi:hypothetical protein
MSISVSIGAKNEITLEEVTFQTSEMFNIYASPLNELFINFFTAIMISIFILVWAVMYIYVRKTIKKIETPFEEPIKARPRKGKYVSVSDLPAEVPEEKVEETPAEKPKKISKKKSKQPKVEEKDKQATDLDSLLEEKGLKD